MSSIEMRHVDTRDESMMIAEKLSRGEEAVSAAAPERYELLPWASPPSVIAQFGAGMVGMSPGWECVWWVSCLTLAAVYKVEVVVGCWSQFSGMVIEIMMDEVHSWSFILLVVGCLTHLVGWLSPEMRAI